MGSIPITRSRTTGRSARDRGATDRSTSPRRLGANPNRTHAAVAQLVERVLGKDEVLGSNPSGSFRVRVPESGRWRTSVGPGGRSQAAGRPAGGGPRSTCGAAGWVPPTDAPQGCQESDGSNDGQGNFHQDEAARQRRHDRAHRPRQDDPDGRPPGGPGRPGPGQDEVVRRHRQGRHRPRRQPRR